MATPTQKANQQPYVPVTTNTQFFKGITPEQRAFTGKDASEDQRHAYNLVESQFGPGRTAYNQMLSQLGMDRQYETQKQENFGDIYGERLSGIAGLLQEQLRGVSDRTGEIYGQAADRVGQGFQAAGQAVQGASGTVQDQLRQQMEMLGLTEAGTDPLAKLQQQSTDLAGRHAISGAGAVGNLAGLGADMQALAVSREGDAAQEWSGKQQQLAQEVMANINTINQEYNQQRDDIFSKIGAHEAARGQAMQGTLKQVIEDRLERERQDKLDKLAEELQRGSLDIQRGYLNLAGDRLGLDTELGRGHLDVARGGLDVSRGHLGVAQGQLALQREQLGMQKQQMEAQLAAADSPYARLEAQLGLQKIEAEIRRLDAQANKDNASASGQLSGTGAQFKGQQGVQAWAQQNLGGQASQFYQDFNNKVIQANDVASRSGISQEQALLNEISKINNDSVRNAYFEAYNIYFGRHASYKN